MHIQLAFLTQQTYNKPIIFLEDDFMTAYSCMNRSELELEYTKVLAKYEACQAKKLNLNMARGKPAKKQLDLVSDILTVMQTPEDCFDGSIDSRNYGELAGLPSARAYWADILDCKPSNIFVGGAASLNMMCDIVSRAYTHGLLDSTKPWCREEKVKFLCPAPGYDRHFQIGEFYGAELIYIPMLSTGPDMDMIEEYVKDPQVKMVWVVPKYSNPDGIIFSDETIRRFANLKPAAPDFAIIWDNAYCMHEFEGEYVPFPDIISMCAEAGRPNMVFEFASTSKITFAGGGTSCMAASEANIDYFTGVFGVQMISYDKVNQLRHVKYLKDKAHTLEIMKRHASIMGPKFRCVSRWLNQEIAPLGFAHWVDPKGGYFVSLYTLPGTAKRVWQLCKEAGVTLTNAGAAFPNSYNPKDDHLRIAPSLPPVEELEEAMDVLTTALKLAALEKLLNP